MTRCVLITWWYKISTSVWNLSKPCSLVVAPKHTLGIVLNHSLVTGAKPVASIHTLVNILNNTFGHCTKTTITYCNKTKATHCITAVKGHSTKTSMSLDNPQELCIKNHHDLYSNTCHILCLTNATSHCVTAYATLRNTHSTKTKSREARTLSYVVNGHTSPVKYALLLILFNSVRILF